MTVTVKSSATDVLPQSPPDWLKGYYGARALFSIIWVALAFAVGGAQPPIGAVLLVAYPLWDCLANYVDATRNGGVRVNPTQTLNAAVSAAVTLAVALALYRDVHDAIGVIGVLGGAVWHPSALDRRTALAQRRRAMAADPERRPVHSRRHALRPARAPP